MVEPAIEKGECLSRHEIENLQANRLIQLLSATNGRNPFYTEKLSQAKINLEKLNLLSDLDCLPLTTKAELVANQKNVTPWGTALSEPLTNYTRYNHTSSTTGNPLRWLDTPDSWQWMLECWKSVYLAAGINSEDRIFFPFSFGPFLGFWTAFEAATQIGAHCIPAGGISSHTRISLIDVIKPTVVACTPTYALRLVEVAKEANLDLSNSTVRVLIVAGEAGGGIGSTRTRIEEGWGARVIDHYGLTEVGPISYECLQNPGSMHLNEREYICEVLDPETNMPVPDGELGELVVTNLGRVASPIIRYKTRDLVKRITDTCCCGRTLSRLEGGILSRADDMVSVRGVNIYPSAIESVVRDIREVIEYRATVRTDDALATLSVDIEVNSSVSDPNTVEKIVATKLHEALGLTVCVQILDVGTLPRYEMKARRFIVEKFGKNDQITPN